MKEKNFSKIFMNQQLTIVLGVILPFLATTLGAALVFFFKKSSKLLNILTIGLASGIMLSASFWSLLLPALEEAEKIWTKLSFVPVAVGFVLGGVFMLFLDLICKKFCNFDEKSGKNKAFKLFSAITIHNIPEGLSVGFAVGTAIMTQSPLFSALMFTIGIALQNFPEGLATSLPIYNCIKNKPKSFFLGILSGAVEPIFAILGFFLASSTISLMPWLLSFSAGAMIYVIIEELLPEIHDKTYHTLGIWAFMLGFVAMMLLDICF